MYEPYAKVRTVRVSDFPPAPASYPKRGALGTFSETNCQASHIARLAGSNMASATAWGTSGLGIYVPVTLDAPATVFKMSVFNGATIDGTVGVAIYDENFNRLATVAGATHTGASVIQTFDTGDVDLMPGIYYLMMCAASTTATYICSAATALRHRTCGLLQQTSITDTPPNPGVPTTFAQTFFPAISAHFKSTV